MASSARNATSSEVTTRAGGWRSVGMPAVLVRQRQVNQFVEVLHPDGPICVHSGYKDMLAEALLASAMSAVVEVNERMLGLTRPDAKNKLCY